MGFSFRIISLLAHLISEEIYIDNYIDYIYIYICYNNNYDFRISFLYIDYYS